MDLQNRPDSATIPILAKRIARASEVLDFSSLKISYPIDENLSLYQLRMTCRESL